MQVQTDYPLKTERASYSHPLPPGASRPHQWDPQFVDWFWSGRGGVDWDYRCLANLAMAMLIESARDFLYEDHGQNHHKKGAHESAVLWLENPQSGMVSFAWCCQVLGIRVPVEKAAALFRENAVRISRLPMPNTDLPD